MKKHLSAIFLLFSSLLCNAGEISSSCTYRGIPLYGRVKVVDFMPDFTVKEVDFMPDLRVKPVSFLPTECGEWQFVDFMPDFTIKFVDFMPDFTVKRVDYFPGL